MRVSPGCLAWRGPSLRWAIMVPMPAKLEGLDHACHSEEAPRRPPRAIAAHFALSCTAAATALIGAIGAIGARSRAHRRPTMRRARVSARITFPTRATRRRSPAFLEGVLYLQNFEYEDAEREFRRADYADSGFVEPGEAHGLPRADGLAGLDRQASDLATRAAALEDRLATTPADTAAEVAVKVRRLLASALAGGDGREAARPHSTRSARASGRPGLIPQAPRQTFKKRAPASMPRGRCCAAGPGGGTTGRDLGRLQGLDGHEHGVDRHHVVGIAMDQHDRGA